MTKLANLLAVIAVLCAFAGASPVLAQPMKCSGEEKTCQAACAKVKTGTSACLTDCGARKASCIRTGCWDSPNQRYCGLAKQ